jgi:adenine-specific DNA-methyltransferase
MPATLRKQWQQEMDEKFSLPSLILESGSYKDALRAGIANPFEQRDRLVICSYNFAAAKAEDLKRVTWDLIVVDEAHRLRNVYKSSNKMARAITEATSHAPKLLLTATPLQNSLMELYGLVSVIDEHVFGDLASFREQFLRATREADRNRMLKERLQPLCTRTLRKQVLEYIRFTHRVPLTQEFLPTDEEDRLYNEVSAYLQRDSLVALPAGQRSLMTLVLRKLLASSTFAIAGTLQSLVRRLEGMSQSSALQTAALEEVGEDFEALPELEEEWEGDAEALAGDAPAALLEELADLRRYSALARSIGRNAKGEALLSVLGTAFGRVESLGAARKAVIFTESRRTQEYLSELLSRHGFAGKIVLINGSNADSRSREIYAAWLARHANSEHVSGSRSADMKAALVEEFRDRATVLIATESAAEGVNLQFCSLVINYDLPWNPQRIEQRIGRCHRYGQQHDVVVVNFLNRRNAADQRVFQLLSEKLRLFDGVFGASDEVLGALESGVDLEKRIAKVYQECRTTEEISAAFDRLQAELEEEIASRMAETRRVLLENFDEEVHSRLRTQREGVNAALSQRQQWLLELTRQELDGDAQFDETGPRFRYSGELAAHGYYNLDWREAERRDEFFYRFDHPLAQSLAERAISRRLPPAKIVCDYKAHGKLISALEPFRGGSGWLGLSKLEVESLETDEYLVFAALSDEGAELDSELCQKLLSVPASVAGETLTAEPAARLEDIRERRVGQILGEVDARNARFFDEEVAKLDHWADDLKIGLEQEIKELDKAIREARRTAGLAHTLSEKLEAQREIKNLEGQRSRKRRELYTAQDEIDGQRDRLISDVEARLKQSTKVDEIFTIRWTLT